MWRGQDITDLWGCLKAGARRMAPVKLTSTEDIEETLSTDWLRQALALEQR